MELTISKIIRWAAGIIFLLAAMGSLIEGQIIAAIFCILIAIICIPVIADPVEKSINLKMSGAARFVLVFVLILGMSAVTPHTSQNTVASDAPSNINTASSEAQNSKAETHATTQNTSEASSIQTAKNTQEASTIGTKNTREADSSSTATSNLDNKGTLNIVTNPAGATITVDGVSKGVSPIEGLSVNPGTHSVTVYLDGYEPQKEKIEIENSETKDLTYILNPLEEQSSSSTSGSEVTSSDTESTSSNSEDTDKTTDDSTTKVVAEWSGNSIKNTETFHITSNEWTISWDTEPGKYGEMNFQIYVYDANGNLKDVAANVIGASNDHTIERGSGDYYLTINTAQPYTIQVKQ